MNDRNFVVSGQRLAEKSSHVESVGQENAADPSAIADLVGTAQALGGLEATSQELTETEKALAMIQFRKAVQKLKDEDLNPGVFSTTEDQMAAIIQSALAEKAAEDSGKVAAAAAGGYEAKFDERDVRWALSLVTWVGKLKPHAWNPLPRLETLGGDLKFAVMGDWGTGLYGAPTCSASIKAAGKFDYIVHLGDVYYSGTIREVQSNFLEVWPKVPGARSRACNGNHEMYSGGYGYFDTILPQFNQSSSCFAIQNPDWLIVGLDSAYAEHDLANDQNAWLRQLAGAPGDRKLVLFSHHQPFSHFDRVGESMVEKLKPLLYGRRITAWYWGHEHRCVIYDRHPHWNLYGRCIGHSGYPYFRKPALAYNKVTNPGPVLHTFWRELPEKEAEGVPRAIVLDGPNPALNKHRDEYGPNGYLTLEFTGPTLTERYYLATGEELTTVVIS